MKISFIGAGKVGTAFGKYLSDNKLEVLYYYNRSNEKAIKSSEYINSKATDRLDVLIEESDCIFITTPDNYIKEVSDELSKIKENFNNKIVVHMSGALTSEVLNSIKIKGGKTYSLHPLQTFSSIEKALDDLPSAYFSIEGKDVEYMDWLLKAIGNEYFILTREQKVKYHLSACVFSNYLVTLMDYGVKILDDIGIGSEVGLKAMEPLITATFENIRELGTKKALTGPIQRKDNKTIEKHLNELDGLDREFYKILGKVTTERVTEDKSLDKLWEN